MSICLCISEESTRLYPPFFQCIQHSLIAFNQTRRQSHHHRHHRHWRYQNRPEIKCRISMNYRHALKQRLTKSIATLASSNFSLMSWYLGLTNMMGVNLLRSAILCAWYQHPTWRKEVFSDNLLGVSTTS